ncbi:PREDICTED: uncharacterized protein LOC106116018 isoform X1 [Papilio xuthus]|uniref:Uncharacterized protein LOC106116018 isoform X1 n=1 Tax=Papilio xuthus TaxID=66420 RepID=A0AAJ6Z4F8_PAPXU|nr:PREDICTED: uncharacterized protein LOC106116018 isoform X1 [Papilio xuthus]
MYGFRLLTFIYQFLWIISIVVVYGVEEAEYLNSFVDPVKSEQSIWQPRHPRVAFTTNEQLACDKPNVYICEEPPVTVAADEGRLCNYRSVRYHEQVYRWVAGRGCLLYTPDFLYATGQNPIHLSAGCFYGPWFAPCLEVVKDDGTCGCYPFDPSFEEVASAVREAIIPAAHGRWERCYYTASDCCSHVMGSNANITDDSQCEATFDGWTCWPPAQSDTVVNEVCSEFAYSNVGPSCHHFSNKQCFSNGSWELQTDYTTCSITPRLLRRYRMNIAVLAFSIASCLPAVFIFFFYKRLRITRVALHRNLLIAIIIRNALVIVSRSEVYIAELTSSGETVLTQHSMWCRALAVCERIAANAVFVCMLVEGVYLHRLIVAVFRSNIKIRWLYGAGAVIAIVPAVAWAVVMSQLNDHSCWIVYTVAHVQWILDAPRIAILLINTLLFIDILRVLLTKLRNSENANQLSTAKATLFLMPLFGTQFLLTAFRPSTTDCTWEQLYYYFSYTLEALQGFIVALLYCYVNKEVHALVKATYKKTEKAVNSRVRGSNPRRSLEANSTRRFTYSTNLPSHNVDDVKDHYTNMKPKLHVAEIMSIPATERLAEILDPIYETVENGLTNEGYDFLKRAEHDDDSGIIPNRASNAENEDGIKHSTVSLDFPQWIESKNVAIDSLNGETLPNTENIVDNTESDPNYEIISIPLAKNLEDVKNTDNPKDGSSGMESEYEDCENMLDEIMQYIDSSDKADVVLDPDILSPNRKSEDKILFVNE